MAKPVEHVLNSDASDFKKAEALRELIRVEADLFTYAVPKELNKKEISERKQIPFNKQLHDAARKGNLEALQDAIKNKADIDSVRYGHETALMRAVQNGYLRCVQALIEAKANLNARNEDGYTALHYAAGKGDFLAVQSLIDAGAQVQIKNYFGDTALNCAQMNEGMFDWTDNKYRETVKILKKAGAQATLMETADNLLLGFLNKTLSF